ncbi:MAG: imidazole glycerol phosphate synthase subunit HisF [Crocinitomicaceae bacterium]|nr:imidazole glycerol phosphate synthase subunit HisF [Crocinitomicaceae bacterium]
MVLKRIMPCLLYNGRGLVKTKMFSNPDYVGDPINAIKIYNEKEVDELILIDICASKENREPKFDKISEFASECFMPFTYGGGVKSLDHFKKLYAIGVEKVAINTLIHNNPQLVKEAVSLFGSQAIIAVMDLKADKQGKYQVYNYHNGKTDSRTLPDYLDFLQNELGVGEILIQNVSREGTWSGFDHGLIKELLGKTKVPVISLGGAKNTDDIVRMLYDTGADAAAIGSMAVYQKKTWAY